jgi:hypothetical protein
MSQKGKEQASQGELFIGNEIRGVVLDILASHQQPSAWDLLGILEERLGWKSRWRIKGVLQEMTNAPTPKVAWRSYLNGEADSSEIWLSTRQAGEGDPNGVGASRGTFCELGDSISYRE